MLGRKARHFIPVPVVSLEELVPRDHFYRHLEQVLDLTFVRQWVQNDYATNGRPSIDPVVFFKLRLVMFFEGIRYEVNKWVCLVGHLNLSDSEILVPVEHRLNNRLIPWLPWWTSPRCPTALMRAP